MSWGPRPTGWARGLEICLWFTPMLPVLALAWIACKTRR